MFKYNIFYILLEKKPCDLSGLNPQILLLSFNRVICKSNRLVGGGEGKSSDPSLALHFAYTLPTKWCSAHSKVPLTCTLNRSHKHLQISVGGNHSDFFSASKPLFASYSKTSLSEVEEA